MIHPAATLSDIAAQLDAFPPDALLTFRTEAGAGTGPGYHLTELKLADVRSIDCGGRLSRFTEARLQLLDGSEGISLTVGKARGILAKSLRALDGLGDAPLIVEFAPANAGLSQFRPASVRSSNGAAEVALTPDAAVCKPQVDLAALSVTSCCGTGATACC